MSMSRKTIRDLMFLKSQQGQGQSNLVEYFVPKNRHCNGKGLHSGPTKWNSLINDNWSMLLFLDLAESVEIIGEKQPNKWPYAMKGFIDVQDLMVGGLSLFLCFLNFLTSRSFCFELCFLLYTIWFLFVNHKIHVSKWEV